MNLSLFRKPGQVEHDYCQDNLSAYLDGQVSAREKARVERHLAECGECRQALSELRATVALLRQAPALPVPRSFALPLSVGVRKTEPRLAWLNPGYLRLAASVATAVLILVVSGDLLLRNGFLGSRQSQAPASEAFGRGAESPVVGTVVESMPEPTSQPAAPLLMAPAPVSDATAAGTQLVTDNAETSTSGAAQATPDGQALGLQARPSETFARPAGAPPLPTSTAGETVPPPAAMEKSVVATAVPSEEPTATATATATITATATATTTPTPEPTVTPAVVGMTGSTGTVVPVSLSIARPVERREVTPLSTESSARRETILMLLRWLEMALGGIAVVLLSLNLWLRLSRQTA